MITNFMFIKKTRKIPLPRVRYLTNYVSKFYQIVNAEAKQALVEK